MSREREKESERGVNNRSERGRESGKELGGKNKGGIKGARWRERETDIKRVSKGQTGRTPERCMGVRERQRKQD